MRAWQQYFLEESKRGPFSCVLLDDGVGGVDMATIFWDETVLGSPSDAAAAQVLLGSNLSEILSMANDPSNRSVLKGVLTDPTRRPQFQQRMVDRYARNAGWR